MANGYDCARHEGIEKRLYNLESEDRLMKEKINFIIESIKKMEKKLNNLENKINAMSVKVAVASILIYTILNIVLKKAGL